MAYIVGFFVEEIEEWLVKEEKVLRKASTIPSKPSCSHLSLEMCKARTPKYCPDCGTRSYVVSEEILPEIKEYVISGYKNNLFDEKNCLCQGNDRCLNCNRKKHSKYRGNRKYDNDSEFVNLSNPKYYFDEDEEPFYCTHYGVSCFECLERYFKNLKCYYLKDGYELSYIEGNFWIWYDLIIHEFVSEDVIIDIDDDMLEFRKKLLEWCKNNGIKGKFQIKYIGCKR